MPLCFQQPGRPRGPASPRSHVGRRACPRMSATNDPCAPASQRSRSRRSRAAPCLICFELIRRFISREPLHRGTEGILDTRKLAYRLAKGDRRAVAKAITLVENDGAGAAGLLKAIGPSLGNAFVLGVTGPP